MGISLIKAIQNSSKKLPTKKLDYENLCEPIVKSTQPLGNFNFRKEDLSEPTNLHVHYCLKCHERGKDSCRKGLKKEDNFVQNPLGNILHGCPLDMHISEAILLKEQNHILAALAIMMINNPLLALTGHRICNDCSKSCIFQKQTQVDVPAIESKIFEDILALPYGVELYILLTQWNPLNLNQPLPIAKKNKKILIVGAGPAGISLSYYLLRAGWSIHMIEANQIQSLAHPKILIKFLSQDIENRIVDGFGGVASYGITSRWNKNYLTIMRLILERHKYYSYQSGVRFGSNYSAQEALQQDGFDHIALTTGASLQKIPNIKNLLGENIRFSADFLMSLQLGGAYKKDSLTNLQIHLPAIVIGGGLTAIDAATELIHYYFRQVEKITAYYNQIIARGEKISLNAKEQKLLDESLAASKIALNERYDFIRQLGGVKIIYHKKMNQSAAYKVNHEEVQAALNLGIEFCEELEIIEIKKNIDDSYLIKTANDTQLHAKTILIATGMSFNPLILQESEIVNQEDIDQFMNQEVHSIKDPSQTNFIGRDKISLVGDSNPFYKGSVVKAILNAKVAAQEIGQIITIKNKNFKKVTKLSSHIISIKKMGNYCLMIIYSHAAKNFQAGEFFKIQNQKSEPVALTPIYIDLQKSEIHFLIEIKGASTKALASMRRNKKIICMGPIGVKFILPAHKKIIIYCEQTLSIYTLLPLIQALKNNHCQISLVIASFNVSFNFYNKIIKNNIDHLYKNFNSNVDQFDYILITNDSVIIPIEHQNKIIKIMNAPMQCMMKGICGQCIRKDQDGQYYYSCAKSLFDFKSKTNNSLNLNQNSLQEKLTNLLIEN